MEMRIVVPEDAGALATHLAGAFGSERISLRDDDHREVDIRVEGEADPLVVRIFDAVERWLHDATIGSAEMWLEGHSYRVARWSPLDRWH